MSLIECKKCAGTGYVQTAYDILFDDLFKQTPKEVWDGYLSNGYTLHEAIKEERSQA